MSLSAGETELLHALQRFIERIEWFSIGRTPEDGLETDKVRLLLAQWDEQVVPHIPSAQNAHILSELRKVAPAIATMRARVRAVFLNELNKLVEARFYWLQWEKAMTAPVLTKERLAEATPEQREVMLAAIRKLMGREFDASSFYQEAMSHADEREEAWKKQHATLHQEWPEECTPEIDSRLQSSDAAACALWMAELLSEMMRIRQDHPSLA